MAVWTCDNCGNDNECSVNTDIHKVACEICGEHPTEKQIVEALKQEVRLKLFNYNVADFYYKKEEEQIQRIIKQALEELDKVQNRTASEIVFESAAKRILEVPTKERVDEQREAERKKEQERAREIELEYQKKKASMPSLSKRIAHRKELERQKEQRRIELERELKRQREKREKELERQEEQRREEEKKKRKKLKKRRNKRILIAALLIGFIVGIHIWLMQPILKIEQGARNGLEDNIISIYNEEIKGNAYKEELLFLTLRWNVEYQIVRYEEGKIEAQIILDKLDILEKLPDSKVNSHVIEWKKRVEEMLKEAEEMENLEETEEDQTAMVDGMVFPDSDSRYLSREEIEALKDRSDYSYQQLLRYAVNEIYARHGYKFDEDGQYWPYYNQYSWYSEQDKKIVSEEELNEYERSNVSLLSAIEKENGF